MVTQVTLVRKEDLEVLLSKIKFIKTRIEHEELVTALSEINELITIVEKGLSK